MNEPDTLGLQQEVQKFVELMGPFIEVNSSFQWEPDDGYLPVIFRAIIRRQFDGLQAISTMVREGIGFATAPLLRPACEEFIWTKYLVHISETDAQRLVKYLALAEIGRNLDAQDRFAGRRVTEELGLLPYLKSTERSMDTVSDKLIDVGKRLGWPKNVVNRGRLPSMMWIANATGEKDKYDYIYHATSRFVHFSVHELQRRTWGSPREGKFAVDSQYFGNYWAHFSLYWGLQLLLETLGALTHTDLLIYTESEDDDEMLQIAERIARIGRPPIITAEELRWPSDAN